MKKKDFYVKETTRHFAYEAARSAMASILVVNDNREIRTSLSTLLSIMGFQVASAGDGQQALDMISENRLGVVFMDFEMPGMDGFALASNIKSSSPRTRIIRITGSPGIIEEKVRNGCVDWVLFKPFKPRDIVESVKGVFRLGKRGEVREMKKYKPNLSVTHGSRYVCCPYYSECSDGVIKRAWMSWHCHLCGKHLKQQATPKLALSAEHGGTYFELAEGSQS